MNKYLQAKGRLRAGEMNKTEIAFAAMLETRKRAGEIVDYWLKRFLSRSPRTSVDIRLIFSYCSMTCR